MGFKTFVDTKLHTTGGMLSCNSSVQKERQLYKKAEEYYRQANSLKQDSWKMYNPAYFLIDKDRNVNEGMELVNKVLEISTDNYNYLLTKGWGLHKLGKYDEAEEILQKSWNLRTEKSVYNHEAFLHLKAAKKAVASQKE